MPAQKLARKVLEKVNFRIRFQIRENNKKKGRQHLEGVKIGRTDGQTRILSCGEEAK